MSLIQEETIYLVRDEYACSSSRKDVNEYLLSVTRQVKTPLGDGNGRKMPPVGVEIGQLCSISGLCIAGWDQCTRTRFLAGPDYMGYQSFPGPEPNPNQPSG